MSTCRCQARAGSKALSQWLFKALELDSIAFDPAADRTHRAVQRTSKGRETVLDLGRRLMMNAAHDEPATLQRSQRLREHSLRHAGHAAPQFRVSLRTSLKQHEKRDRPFVREQLDDSPRAGNADQRFHGEGRFRSQRLTASAMRRGGSSPAREKSLAIIPGITTVFFRIIPR